MFSKKTYTDKLPLKMNMLTIMSQSEICLLVEAYFLNKFLQMKILRQGDFSKEKRFNTFFINLIYNKGGEEPIKKSLLDSIYKKNLQAAVVRTKSFPQFFSHCF